MIFASKTPRDLNRDPEPYVSSAPDFERYEQAEDNPKVHPVIFDPRPEFDHPQNNEPNAILLAIRTIMTEDGVRGPLSTWYADAATYLTGGTQALGLPILPGMADHARRVLSRLAQMETRP